MYRNCKWLCAQPEFLSATLYIVLVFMQWLFLECFLIFFEALRFMGNVWNSFESIRGQIKKVKFYILADFVFARSGNSVKERY